LRVLEVRNVHAALPQGLDLIAKHSVSRDSRFGKVLVLPWPVATVYSHPLERVIFWEERDANPFFHLYEALWMLAGRNDVEPLLRYVKTFNQFSDDGETIHDAYGHRWRKRFHGVDQIREIVYALKQNRDDRRCVLQMWSPESDLGRVGKAFPCNLTATFQVGVQGKLDMTVFCRSNDMILGAYGANAFHFSMLLEYMAARIGVEPGVYTQISTNMHIYDHALNKGMTRMLHNLDYYLDQLGPYPPRSVEVTSMSDAAPVYLKTAGVRPALMPTENCDLDVLIKTLLYDADSGFISERCRDDYMEWFNVCSAVLKSHHVYKSIPAGPSPLRFQKAYEVLQDAPQDVDLVQAAYQWFQRREVMHWGKEYK